MAPGNGAGGRYLDQLMRLCRFRRRHPGVDVGRSKVDGWDAAIPLQGDGLRCLHRGSLTALLDDAETILAGGDARARPD